MWTSVHVLADAWLIDGSAHMREHSLKRVVEIFDASTGLEWTPLHGEHYSLIVDGFHPRTIQSAILFDLTSSFWEVREVSGEINRFDLFHSLISVAVMLREVPLETMDALRTSRTECGILWHALAASRTLLCSREYGPVSPKFFAALYSLSYYSSYVPLDKRGQMTLITVLFLGLLWAIFTLQRYRRSQSCGCLPWQTILLEALHSWSIGCPPECWN